EQVARRLYRPPKRRMNPAPPNKKNLKLRNPRLSARSTANIFYVSPTLNAVTNITPNSTPPDKLFSERDKSELAVLIRIHHAMSTHLRLIRLGLLAASVETHDGSRVIDAGINGRRPLPSAPATDCGRDCGQKKTAGGEPGRS